MSSSMADSMNGFVYSSLSKILKESSKSRDKQFREVASDVQAQIIKASEKNKEEARADKNADKYFFPFKLACNWERPNIKMLHASLDAIQRMIAYGYLSGDSYVDNKVYPPIDLDSQNRKADKEDSKKLRKRKLVDVLIETIYMCSTTIDDDQVQIQVIKTLITAVQSKTCNVHDHSILLAVRSCYHIYLTARNTSNQTTARAILTQMLNVVFRRMEHFAQLLQEKRAGHSKLKGKSLRNGIRPEEEKEEPQREDSQDTTTAVVKEIIHSLVAKVAAEQEPKRGSNATREDESAKQDKDSIERQIALKLSIMQNDAYLLFRALTHLSMKKIPESIDPVAIKSKALALELLLSVIQNSGPMLRTHPKFVGFIKDKLVRSLLQNCVSSIPRIYKMAAPMFLALVAQFKPQMKYEIGVILNNIFLNMLASPMSSYMQKSMAVVILLKLCKDPQTIVELFLNYDCDIKSEDKIFEAIIIQLEKVAQGRFMSEALMSPQNESSLRLNALEAIGHVMTSLIKWCAVLKKSSAQKESRERNENKDINADEASENETNEYRGSVSKPAFSAHFNLQRERRNLTEKGILLFNRKPKNGIKFLVENGLLKEDPKAIADFLKAHKKLDKTQIGEYLGEDKDFNKKVLYMYIEDFDFKGMEFDEALRYWLKGFRLPGEGQKIDRMVVKFADQYTNNNPYERGGKFRTADGAYVLAYATIMLHTDLHNPGVKNKMSKEQFINMNRGIDDGNDIDPTFMSTLYDRILQEEIHMTGDSAPSEWQNAASLHPRKRQTMFQKQTENLIKKTENLIRTKPKWRGSATKDAKEMRNGEEKKSEDALRKKEDGEVDEWYDAKHADLESLQPMFDLLWCPAFATFSLVLKENDEPRVAKLCLENYREAVHLSSLFSMDTPRDAFVKSLQHFSLLGTSKPLSYKNVEAIKMLMHIAYTEGDHLKDSWGVVLQCISEYDKLMRRSPASSQAPVDVFDSGSSIRNARREKRREIKVQQVHHQNAEKLREQLDPALVDRVFTQSAHLCSDAIVDFVRNLTEISQNEVYTMNETPRVFSLQKIVEITYYNMNRIRLVWTRIWNILSEYFAKAGCHPNLQVSLYSIDSLRQLAMKFLEKDELAHYHFQKQFLKPFEVIMANTQAQESKALIIQCISRMVLGRVSNVRSGWKSVFVVLRIAAKSRDKSLVTAAFELTERIMLNYFTLISNTMPECVATLGSFAANSFTTISLKSLDYIAKCAQNLSGSCIDKHRSEQKGEEAQDQKASTSRSSEERAASSFPTWMTLLVSCSVLLSDKRFQLQNRALELLFGTLEANGDIFTLENWGKIFTEVLFPIFHEVGAYPRSSLAPTSTKDKRKKPKPPPPPQPQPQPQDWLKTTCLKAMTRVVQLFAKYQNKIGSLLPEILGLLNSCVTQGNLELAKIGIESWKLLMAQAGANYKDDEWKLVLESLHSLNGQSLPHELQAPRLRKSMGLPSKSPRKFSLRQMNGARSVHEEKETNPVTSKGDPDVIRTDFLSYSRVMVKCIVQRHMMAAAFEAIQLHYQNLKESHIKQMLSILKSTIEFLATFNADIDLQKKLFEARFRSKSGSLFNLVDQEVESYSYYMKILQIMYQGSNPHFDDFKAADAQLRVMGSSIFKRYIDDAIKMKGKASKESKSLGEVVCSLIEGFSSYTEAQMKENMPTFLPRIFELVEHGDVQVRRAVARFMRRQISPLLPFSIEK